MTEVRTIVVLGGGAVGKSAISIAFTHSHFIEFYDPTLEDHYFKQWVVDEEVAYFNILDTAGQEEYSALRQQYMRRGQGFILVYDITNGGSFQEVRVMCDDLRRARDLGPNDRVPMVIVGNKADLASARVVSAFAGQEFAKSVNAAFLEASAKTNTNIEEIFNTIVREMRKSAPRTDNDEAPPPKKKSACNLL